VYKRILLTLDGSPLSRTAIARAANLASGTDAEVVALEVIESSDVIRNEAIGAFEFTDGDPERIAALAEATRFNEREQAKTETDRAKSELEAAGVRSVRTAVEQGYAGNAIVDFANAEGCEAIVMATRGHGGLGREVLGSVAEYVLRHAGATDVILVGPRGK
jgi:nucleotide-binding universal stress UspA family protein